MRMAVIAAAAIVLPLSAYAQSQSSEARGFENDLKAAQVMLDHVRKSALAWDDANQRTLGDLMGALAYWQNCAKSIACWESIKPTAAEDGK